MTRGSKQKQISYLGSKVPSRRYQFGHRPDRHGLRYIHALLIVAFRKEGTEKTSKGVFFWSQFFFFSSHDFYKQLYFLSISTITKLLFVYTNCSQN